MRVAILTWSTRRVGGIEEYLSILVPAIHEAGLDVALWHESDIPTDRRPLEVPGGVDVFSAAKMGTDAAIQALRDWKPDVLYTQGLMDLGVESRLLDIAPSVFFVHTYTGTCISGAKTTTRPHVEPCGRRFGWPCLLHYFPRGCGGRSPVTMWRQFNRQTRALGVLDRYDMILTHTEHMKREMENHGLRTQVVPYPVAIEVQALDAVKRDDGAWQLLFAGRMDALKGGHILIDAVRGAVPSIARPIHLVFAGDGPHRASWEAHAAQAQAATSELTFSFTGWIAQHEVGELMARSHLLVVPSLWPEPFGSVGAGAGQHGVPAAAFAVGGIPEWLADGVTGHLAPADPPTADGLARAIVRCLEDPAHYDVLSRGARKMAEKFTMERHMPALLDVLTTVSRRVDAG